MKKEEYPEMRGLFTTTCVAALLTSIAIPASAGDFSGASAFAAAGYERIGVDRYGSHMTASGEELKIGGQYLAELPFLKDVYLGFDAALNVPAVNGHTKSTFSICLPTDTFVCTGTGHEKDSVRLGLGGEANLVAGYGFKVSATPVLAYGKFGIAAEPVSFHYWSDYGPYGTYNGQESATAMPQTWTAGVAAKPFGNDWSVGIEYANTIGGGISSGQSLSGWSAMAKVAYGI